MYIWRSTRDSIIHYHIREEEFGLKFELHRDFDLQLDRDLDWFDALESSLRFLHHTHATRGHNGRRKYRLINMKSHILERGRETLWSMGCPQILSTHETPIFRDLLKHGD